MYRCKYISDLCSIARLAQTNQKIDMIEYILVSVPIRARLGLGNQASHFKPLVTTLTKVDLWSIK